MRVLLALTLVLLILNAAMTFLAWWDVSVVNTNLWTMWSACSAPAGEGA